MVLSTVICCIALNEELYLDEWIEYHTNKLGFNHIYVYDNSDDGKLDLRQYKNVTVIHMPGKCKQVPAYNHFMENHSHKHDWCAFIDVDEFFVLKKHSTIQEYIGESHGLSTQAIGVNWVMYGSGGQEKYKPRPVMERFTVPEPGGVNPHIKCLVKTTSKWGTPVLTSFTHCHYPQDVPITVHTPKGLKTVWNTPFNEKGDTSIIQLNHYFCKSREEFMLKIERGRADIIEKRTMNEFF